jgi:hypothetical protein
VAEIATMAYAKAEKAAATRAAYASDWRDFAAWCAARGATPLPAHVGIVAAYLSWLAQSGRKASTIGRRAAAIGHRHKLAGYEPPTGQEAVKAVMRGIRRTIGAAVDRKSPATADIITTMLTLCPPTLAGCRDRALLALGFAGRSAAASSWHSRSPTSLKSPMACVSESAAARLIRTEKAPRSGLALFRGAAEPIRVGTGGDDVRLVGHSIDQRLA